MGWLTLGGMIPFFAYSTHPLIHAYSSAGANEQQALNIVMIILPQQPIILPKNIMDVRGIEQVRSADVDRYARLARVSLTAKYWK